MTGRNWRTGEGFTNGLSDDDRAYLAAEFRRESANIAVTAARLYQRGQRDALAAAVQRVEALPRFYDGAAYPDEVIAAVTGCPHGPNVQAAGTDLCVACAATTGGGG